MSRAEDNTNLVISKMMPLIIEKTLKPTGNWGILFNEVNGIDEAWVANDHFMVRWTDFGDFAFNRELPFLTEEEIWKQNTLTVSNDSQTDSRIHCPVELLHERLESLRPKTPEEIENIANAVGIPFDEVDPGNYIRVRIPCIPLYNMMWEFSKEKRLRTRIIIKSNPVPERYVADNRVILETNYIEGEGLYLQLPEVMRYNIPGYDPNKMYKIAETEKYNQRTMRPRFIKGQNRYERNTYECDIDGFPVVNENNIMEALNAEFVIPRRRVYKGTEILLHYSRAGFLMRGETMKDVLNSELYTNDVNILRVPFKFSGYDNSVENEAEYYNYPPIMLDCDTLFAVIENLYYEFRFLDFFISLNPFAPVLIEGVREDRNYPTIQTVLTTLSENVGDIN